MLLSSKIVEYRSQRPLSQALEGLRAEFPREERPPLALMSLQPLAQGTFLLGKFRGTSVVLSAVDTTAGTLNPVLEGDLIADQSGSLLVGTVRYDRATIAVGLLLAIPFLAAVFFLLREITHSYTYGVLASLCVLGFIAFRAVPILTRQETVLQRAIERAAFVKVDTAAQNTT